MALHTLDTVEREQAADHNMTKKNIVNKTISPCQPLLENFGICYPCVGHVRVDATSSMPGGTL